MKIPLNQVTSVFVFSAMFAVVAGCKSKSHKVQYIPVSAEWQNSKNEPSNVETIWRLVVRGEILLVETRSNSYISKVEIRPSTGDRYTLSDENSDGVFDTVNVLNQTGKSDAPAQTESTPVSAEWLIADDGRTQGKLSRQLLVDKKSVFRESDVDRNNKIDQVRIRVSTGIYYLLKDSNGDGKLDSVRLGP